MHAEGWAVVEDGEIDMRTVSPHRRAAIVNWLVVGPGIPVWDDMDDESIYRLFDIHKGPTTKTVPVRCTVITPLAGARLVKEDIVAVVGILAFLAILVISWILYGKLA